MRWRKQGIFWGGGVGLFGLLMLLAGCSSDTNAASTNHWRRENPAQEESPLFDFTQRKRPKILAGGLEAPETGTTLRDNLLVNGDFSDGLQGWNATTPCFRPDSSTRAPNGKPTLKIENPDSCGPFTKIAVNEFVAPPGVYSIGGEIKTPVLTESKNPVVGSQMDLFTACETELVNGSGDWQKFAGKHCVVAPGTNSPFRLAIDGNTSGSAWFANMYVRREIPPLVQTFILYPNYRGYLFADQPQAVRAAVTLNRGPDLRSEDLTFQLEATRADTGAKTDHTYKSPADDFTATLDFAALPAGVYQVRAKLLGPNGDVLFEQPPYRVVKVDSKAGDLLKAWIDDRNLAHFGDGAPHFVIGIYDTSNYSNSPDAYAPAVEEISQAPINMMVNYYITNAPISAVNAYTDELQRHGIFFLPTVSNFYEDNNGYPKGLAARLGASSQDDFVARYADALEQNRAVVGYYVQDEPAPDKVARTFHQYQVIKTTDPAGFNLIALNRPRDVQFWKDAVDVVGVDPYPLWLPVDNYIGEVGDWTRTAVAAVHGSRPVWTIIQFFQADAMSSWPTEQQLYDMTWMAIAEGASGVFYWSHGIRALSWVRDPVMHAALYRELINVTREIKDLEPVLLRPDKQVLASKPSQDIVTREKTGPDGVRYVIAYNQSNAPAPARFVLQSPAQSVTVRRGRLPIEIKNGTRFEDQFAPYEAKVYEIR
ncbi:hypothetical protein [Candidatus Binatus sp.]|uniref:hypothetical protein n=1 Tax=Candidatus Binatus sp. TaxID=2811406 RepID=UPI003CC60EA7